MRDVCASEKLVLRIFASRLLNPYPACGHFGEITQRVMFLG